MAVLTDNDRVVLVIDVAMSHYGHSLSKAKSMNASHEQKPLILITGSSGLIGGKLVQTLSSDYRIVGLDIQPPAEQSPAYPWIECDMTDDESVASSLESVRDQYGSSVASVIHLAAYYDFSGEPSPLYQDLTVEGTRRLLRGLGQFDEVEQFVFSGTLLVMKSAEDDRPVDASSPVEAEWAYPRSKLAAERVIEEEHGQIAAVVLRMAGVYDDDGHSLPISQHIRRIYEKQLESYFFPGDKTAGQAFIHLDDLATCVQRVVECRKSLYPYEVFVIGEEDVMSYEELQETIGKMIHRREWPALRIPKVAAKAGAWVKEKLAGDEEEAPFIKPWMVDLADQNYPVNIRQARTKLNWEPKHTLRDTLPEMIARLRENPRRWYETNGLPVPENVQQGETTGVSKS